MAFRCVFFRTARLPLLGVTLVVLAACGSIEEQCRDRVGASEAAYDQCLEREYRAAERVQRQYRAIENMTRYDTQSLPSFP